MTSKPFEFSNVSRIIGSVRFAMEGCKISLSRAAVCHHATLIVCCELNVGFFLSEGAKGLISV